MSLRINAMIAIGVLLATLAIALVLAWRIARIQSLKDFNDWAGGVQNLVLTIALFVGGAWALGVFVVLQQAPIAAEDLADTLSKRRAMEMSFAASEYRDVRQNVRDVVITSTFHNAGTRPLQMSLARAVVCIRPAGSQCAQSLFVPFMSLDGGNEVTNTVLIDPGATKNFPIHWRTSKPGLYLFKFYSPMPEHIQGSGNAHLSAYLGMYFFNVQ